MNAQNPRPATVVITEENPENIRRIESPEGVCRVVILADGLDAQAKPGDKASLNGGAATVVAVDERSITLEW